MKYLFITLISFFVFGCSAPEKEGTTAENQTDSTNDISSELLNKYVSVRLTSDMSQISDNQRKMVSMMIEAAQIMDDLFWKESFGDKNALLSSIEDEGLRKYAEINYGPWDRLNGDKSFIDGFGAKPEGAQFYPADITKQEFEAFESEDKTSQYTLLRRDSAGNLTNVPYHVAFAAEVQKAAELLRKCAELAEDQGFKNYLNLRAEALLTDNYFESDMAWMDMKSNQLELVIGPIENYEDKLYNYKAAHEGYVLIKDMAWSEKLSKFAGYLPELQEGIPVPAAYKTEKPGSNADLNAYDVVYYAGDCNSGSKTIAINLPNDEKVQLAKGTRRLQLKNAMRAKFDQILVPLAQHLIVEEQRGKITFDAFFSNTMFHEVAHGLGIKNTINGKGTVREALKEHYSALEEGKADVLGLYMITQLIEKGELEGQIDEYYITFMASIFRSVRFGASSAHGRANMIRFNFFKEMGAFSRHPNGQYEIHLDKMKEAMDALSTKILTLQGNGDYDAVGQLVNEQGVIREELKADLDRLAALGIPVDIVFEQGVEVLGLN